MGMAKLVTCKSRDNIIIVKLFKINFINLSRDLHVTKLTTPVDFGSTCFHVESIEKVLKPHPPEQHAYPFVVG